MNHPTATVTVIGGPTVVIELGGVRLLTDPTFDDAGSEYAFGPVALVKTRGPAVPVTGLGRIDAVLLSHDQHADNLDDTGRWLLARVPLVITTPAAAARLGGNAVGLRPGERVDVPGAGSVVTVTAVEAVHGPPAVAAVTGDVTGFLAQPARGGPAVYVSGDNVSMAAVAAAGRAPVGLAVLHAGSARLAPLGAAALSFSATDTVAAALHLGDCPVLVVHDDGWSHLTEGHHDVVAAFTHAGLSHRLLDTPRGATSVVPLC